MIDSPPLSVTDNNSPHARTHAHTDTIQLQVNVHIQNPLCVYSLFTEEYNGKYLCQFTIILPRQGQKKLTPPLTMMQLFNFYNLFCSRG